MNRRRRAAALAGALALGATGPVGPAAAPASASSLQGEAPCDVGVLETSAAAESDQRTSRSLAQMGVPAAHEVTTGRGQVVAVLDSGFRPLGGVDVAGAVAVPGLPPTLLSGHGMITAGLIAGSDGAAPDAAVLDVRVMDTETPDPQQGQVGVTSRNLTAGIRALIARHRTQPFGVANISLSVREPDPALAQAVKDLQARDVVVVAAAGNVVQSGEDQVDTFEGTARNDAEVYPADYPGVVAVSAVPPAGEDPRGLVLPNADTDVAAPTFGGLSVNLTGTSCDVEQVATSWAAAQVSGVVALLRSQFEDETAEQVVARLVASAEGSASGGNPWTGAGVVQAHDALTRELSPRRDGTLPTSRAQVGADAQAPPAPDRVDLFGPARAKLLWAGLLGGALLALAAMARPLLRRD